MELGFRIAFAMACAFACSGAELRLRAIDEHGKPIAARFEVHGPDGKMHLPSAGAPGVIFSRPPGRPDTGSPYLRSFVVASGAVATVPVPAAGRYRVIAEHGLEYERASQEVDVGGVTEIRIRPWIRLRERGWWSGDLHVHRPMEDAPVLLEAEDLNFGAVFTMWNRQNLWGQGALPTDWIRQTASHRWMTVTNAEDERRGGAWMLHGLTAALGLERVVPDGARTTESWDPPGVEFVREARRQKSARPPGGLFPWFDLEKPIWWEAPVMMAVERPDSMGLLHNHYDQYGMYDNEAWGRKRDTDRFPGGAGFSDYSLHLMYRYWNLGWMVPPTAGAASGVLPNPAGYNRVYVRLDGEFSVAKWYEGVRAGRLFVTNGPVVVFEPNAVRGRLAGRLEVASRDELDRVEIVANGEVLQSWKPAGKREFRAKLDLRLAPHQSWVAARAYAKNELTVRLGHSAPVTVPGGRWNRRSEDARYFTEWIEELQRNPRTPPGSKAAALYEQALAVYRREAESK